MRKLSLILFISFAAIGSNAQSSEEMLKERTEKLESLIDTSKKVLNAEDLKHFQSIAYFDINEKFIVEAKWKKCKGRRFKMPTSTDRMPIYRRFGYLTFEIDSQAYRLTVYQNMGLRKQEGYEDYLFVPLRDLTSGEETYGGGRYLDFKVPTDKTVEINFNALYNPYCAYSHRYSCPIPPEENTLNLRIVAGEKTPIYKD